MRSTFHYAASALSDWKKPEDLGLRFTSVRRTELVPGGRALFETAGAEMCLVVVKGRAEFRCGLPGGGNETGSADFKDMVFLPPRSRAEFSGDAVIMAYEAPSELGAEFGHIRFRDVDADPEAHHVYGRAENGSRRDVWNYVDSGFRCTRLMLGICEGSAGGWTAWPPHEHGKEREEVYVYFDMGKSFAVQLVYEDLSEDGAALVVREGDLVAIAKGYHPNVGCPAGRISYVYCMTATVPGERKFMDLRIQKEFGDKFE